MAKWRTDQNGNGKSIITDGNGRMISYADLHSSGVDKSFGAGARCAAIFNVPSEAKTACQKLNSKGFA